MSTTSIYMRYIDPLAKILRKYIDSRRPDIPEDVRDKYAKFLATIFVLCEEWGQGDALAGYFIERLADRKTFEMFKTVLEGLGVKLPPSSGIFANRALCVYTWDVARYADFGDENVNNIMRVIGRGKIDELIKISSDDKVK